MSYKESMHPKVSKAEIEVFKALSMAGLTSGMVTQKTIILKATIPDFQWTEKRKAVYLDGEQVHRKKQEQDEEITDLLEARGWNVLRITYTAPLSKQKLVEVVAEIKEFVGAK